jgi:hypothetical protein
MPKMSLFYFSTIILAQSLIGFDATAQSFLGLSVNYGDALTFTPNYSGLLLDRKSFTSTPLYSHQKRFPSDSSVIPGGRCLDLP